jgi:P pilus assembly chaperone PapD
VGSGLKVTLRRLTGCDAIALTYNINDTVNIGSIRFLLEAAKKELSLSVRNPEAKENLMRLMIAGTLSQDKGSMHRLCVKAIPSASRKNDTQQITASSSIKLINRSDALKDADSDKQIEKLNRHVTGERLEGLLMTPKAMGKRGLSIAHRRFRCILAL